MNYTYLLDLIATHLYSSARMYDHGGNLLGMCRKDDDIEDDELCASLLGEDISTDEPLLFSVNDTLVFSWIPTDEHYFLLGPTHFISPISGAVTAPVKLTYNLIYDDLDFAEFLKVIPPCTLQILADDSALLFNADRAGAQSFISPQHIIEENCLPEDNPDETLKTLHQTIFDNVERSVTHNPYNHEKLEVNYVRNGDVEGLRELLEERFPGRYGTLSENPLRQEIYLGIVAITLASRAAIDSGLHPETAFYLSDVSIRQLDNSRDPNEIIRITKDAELHYARLVRELKSENQTIDIEENPHISRCKDYIFTHMHGRITVQEIAAAIGLESNYLSALFKRCEKMTLKQYITKEKVRLIKNLLTYSSYSYIEIATYLGFSSQSHMGMEFKRITGMTPSEYRAKYAREDFINESTIYP